MRLFKFGTTVLFAAQILAFGSGVSARADSERPLALVYQGEGACLPCIHGAIRVAHLAGFDVRRVDRTHWDDGLLSQAKLWIQPGGESNVAARVMGPELMEKVRQFVAHGAGYVGFCAGAFIATDPIGDGTQRGLGIVPGRTSDHIHEDSESYRLERIRTLNGDRWVLFAGGAQIIVDSKELEAVQGRATSWSLDGQILSIEAHYGSGKVAISGFHPEASALWKLGELFYHDQPLHRDPDGADYDFAVDMIRYATSP
jgi:glutamine amidotransferase-like uncharacterized protein